MKWRGPFAGVAAVLVTAGVVVLVKAGVAVLVAGVSVGGLGPGAERRVEERAQVEMRHKELLREEMGHEEKGDQEILREMLWYGVMDDQELLSQGILHKNMLRRGLLQKKLPQTVSRHWNLGDVVERELDGKVYQFACIDQNYSDRMENHGPYALFLCTSVIPADLGSEYRYEELEDGTFDYVFYPGEIVNFGEENDYKYSRVRKWLEKCESGVPEAVNINTGVDVAYEGRTEDGMYGQLDGVGLRGSTIGSQKLTEKLFCLSVDEALEYREELWKFEGARVENPESQYGPYSKGYWLRTPVGDGEGFKESGMVYIVDLVSGTIRPQTVKPVGGNGAGELDVTGTTGVRPAFAMLQGA